MALEIFKLVGSILVDNDAANESISQTDENAQGVGATLLAGIGTAAKWAAGIVAAGVAGAAALYKAASSAAANSDEIDKMSQRLGLTRESYQELDYVLSQSGVDINSFQTGMKSLVAKMDAVSEGNATATDNFAKLGVEVLNADGTMRDQEDVLFETIAAFQAMEDSTEKSRLAQEIFGKQGQEILPLLNSEAGSLEELREQAHEYGLVLDDETIDAGVEFTDTMDSLQRSMTSVMTQVGTAVMPMIQSAADWVLAHMPEIQTVCEAVFAFIQDGVAVIGDVVSSVVSWISGKISDSGLTIDDVMTTVQTVFTEVQNAIVDIWNTVGKPCWDAIRKIVQLVAGVFQSNLPAIKNTVQTAFQDIKSLWENHLKPAFQAIQNFVQNVLAPIFKTVFQNVILPVVSAVFRGISELWTGTLKPIFTNIIDFITNVFSGNWKAAFQNLVNIVSSVFSGIKTAVKTPINAVIGVVNSFIKGLNKLKIPSWVPGVGGKGINIATIPTLAKGGVLEKGQTGFLEGNGAEAVVPLENNQRWISAVARDMDAALDGADLSQVTALLQEIIQLLDRLLRLGIYIDADKLVGYLAERLDRKLGDIRARKERTE